MSIVDDFIMKKGILPSDSLKGSWNMGDKSPRERLVALRDFLRTPTPNLAWNFGTITVDPDCGTAGCGIGWYCHLTGVESAVDFFDKESSYGVEFQMPEADFYNIFTLGLGKKTGKALVDIIPLEVADAIDVYLEKVENE